MVIDLHSHSVFSDGALPPAQLVDRAAANGVDILALTDHDCVDGLEEAHEAARAKGVRIVDGLELTTRQGFAVHVLCYFSGPDHPGLREMLDGLRRSRRERMERMVERLRKHGIPIALEDASNDRGAVGRPHLAAALVRRGHASSLDDAFRRYLRKGGIGFVPHEVHTPAAGVRRIRELGGAPVLAHPSLYPSLDFLDPLISLGLAGIEVYHPDNRGREADLSEIVRRHGLAATGGSDFHGLDESKHAEVGAFTTPEADFEALMRLLDRQT